MHINIPKKISQYCENEWLNFWNHSLNYCSNVENILKKKNSFYYIRIRTRFSNFIRKPFLKVPLNFPLKICEKAFNYNAIYFVENKVLQFNNCKDAFKLKWEKSKLRFRKNVLKYASLLIPSRNFNWAEEK